MIYKIIRKVLLLSIIFILFFSSWFYFEVNSPPKDNAKKIFFYVEKGKSARSIAHNLREERIIKKEWTFLLAYELFFHKKSLKAGEYSFSLPVSVKDVLHTLTDGKMALHSFTVPEGLTRKEIADLLESLFLFNGEDFLKASVSTESIFSFDKKAANLEGYLYPETYYFPRNITATEIVSTLTEQFNRVFSEEWKVRASEIGMTVREIVILASLIEKETSLPEEKSSISAVFHNRLKIGMKLDCDPTIIYVLKQENKFKGRLRKKDLKLDNPYNTYLFSGLPPSPIANPGKDSLRAALYPDDNNYLYFVSKNDGSHYFSSSFKEHQKAVNKFQRK
ncbi:MAG: endolytic transglycosylase MltG [Acidobacteriota bacterium]|nr:endolytic transglycosylase MltG [Acidobacteriota bacterium]